MGKVKEIKPKENRVKEGVELLRQLKGAGVTDNSAGFIDLKIKISEWISGEEGWEGVVDFREYGRMADIDLPKYSNRIAGINFRVKKAF
jgi:hypothetical protein